MRYLKLILPIVALVAAIVIFFIQFSPTPTGSDKNTARTDSTQSEQSSQSADLDSTEQSLTKSGSVTLGANSSSSDFGVVPEPSSESAELNNEPSENNSTPTAANTAQPNTDYPETYGYEIANENISDEEFNALVLRLAQDPFLLNELLNELRSETDPARIKRLTALLGQTGSAEVMAVGEELAYSSVPATQKAGLDLLSRVASNNPEAYDIAVSILSSASEPAVLVSTMNVLASPINASAETKSNAITQIMPLAEHESEAVRRHSVSLLPRLTKDEALTPILYNALADSSAKVRSAATFAIASLPDQSPEVIERLLGIAENTDEADGIRRGAIHALQKKSPSAETNARISKAKIQMREAALAAQ